MAMSKLMTSLTLVILVVTPLQVVEELALDPNLTLAAVSVCIVSTAPAHPTDVVRHRKRWA